MADEPLVAPDVDARAAVEKDVESALEQEDPSAAFPSVALLVTCKQLG